MAISSFAGTRASMTTEHFGFSGRPKPPVRADAQLFDNHGTGKESNMHPVTRQTCAPVEAEALTGPASRAAVLDTMQRNC